MKVIVGCEFSQIVTKAFRDKGHEAYSCDLLPTEGNPDWHFQEDIFEVLKREKQFDLGIFHPPCTHLAVSGSRWFKEKRKEQEEALIFVNRLLSANIPMVCLENPVSIISSRIRKPDQIIQPWMFGHPESKSTCLWLKNLQLLIPTHYADFKNYRCRCGNIFSVELGKYGCCDYPAKPLWDNMTKSGQNKLTPSQNRAKERSRTYLGIANAMAEQWRG
jgi:site-specific DNA-cytosine methylase